VSGCLLMVGISKQPDTTALQCQSQSKVPML